MISTSGVLTALKCTKSVFRPGLRPGSHWGSLQLTSGLSGHTSKGQGREEEGKGEERGRRERKKGEGRKRGRQGPAPLSQIPGSAPEFSSTLDTCSHVTL